MTEDYKISMENRVSTIEGMMKVILATNVFNTVVIVLYLISANI